MTEGMSVSFLILQKDIYHPFYLGNVPEKVAFHAIKTVIYENHDDYLFMTVIEYLNDFCMLLFQKYLSSVVIL